MFCLNENSGVAIKLNLQILTVYEKSTFLGRWTPERGGRGLCETRSEGHFRPHDESRALFCSHNIHTLVWPFLVPIINQKGTHFSLIAATNDCLPVFQSQRRCLDQATLASTYVFPLYPPTDSRLGIQSKAKYFEENSRKSLWAFQPQL